MARAGSPGDVRAGGAFVEIWAHDGPFQKGLSRIRNQLQSFSATLRKAGTGMFLGGTAIGVPLMLAAKSAATFEDSLLGMRAAAGLTEEEVSKVESVILEMSKNMGVSASNIGNAFLELLKAGMPLDQVLEGAGRSAVEFARISGVSSEEAATFMKVAMNSFGVSSKEAVDTLSAAADASETSIAAMVESFALVGSAGVAWNQSLFDLSQGLAGLARYGIKGEEAGTGIKTMLMRITSPTRVTEEALQQLGLTVNSFRDADQKLLPLAQIMEILGDGMLKVGPTMRDKLLGDIFGDRGIRVVSAFTQIGVNGMGSIRDAMLQNLPVAAKFQILMSGISGGFEKIYAAVQRLSVAFTTAMGDSLAYVFESLVKVIDMVAAFVTQFPTLSKWVAGAAGALIALGAAAIALSAVLSVAAAGIGVLAGAVAALASPVFAAVAVWTTFALLVIASSEEMSNSFITEMEAIGAAIANMDLVSAWELLKVNISLVLVAIAQKVHTTFAAIRNTLLATGDIMVESFGAAIMSIGNSLTILSRKITEPFLLAREAIAGLSRGDSIGDIAAKLNQVRKEIATANAKSVQEVGESMSLNRYVSNRKAEKRGKAAEELDMAYEATTGELLKERDAIKERIAINAAAAGGTSAEPSSQRPQALPGTGVQGMVVSLAEEPGFGRALGTFASEIAGQIGVGPELNAIEQTAANTEEMAAGIRQLNSTMQIAGGQVPNVDSAALEQSIAGVSTAIDSLPDQMPDDRELVSAVEKTAAASEKQVTLLERMLNRGGSARLSFS